MVDDQSTEASGPGNRDELVRQFKVSMVTGPLQPTEYRTSCRSRGRSPRR